MHRHDAKGFLKMSFDPASLSYNAAGLIPTIAQDETTGEVLMMAWMNQDADHQTLDSGRVTYWSRSRQAFWIKGESSGNTQALVDFRIDCDRDCLLGLCAKSVLPATPTAAVVFTPQFAAPKRLSC